MEVKKSTWYVYILECVNGSFYVGMTTDVNKRFDEHKASRGAKFTRQFPPLRLAWQEQHGSQFSARQREVQLKGWSRQKKYRLISGII